MQKRRALLKKAQRNKGRDFSLSGCAAPSASMGISASGKLVFAWRTVSF